MKMHKVFVGSALTMTLAVGVANAATTDTTAPTKSAKCWSAFEKVNKLVETIGTLCGAGTTTQTTVGTVGGTKVTEGNAYGKTSTVLAACTAITGGAAKLTALEFFGPKSYNPTVATSVSGRTFLFGDRAFFVDSAVGSDKVVVTLSRGMQKRFLSKATTPSKGSANLRVCATSAASAKEFKDRKEAACDCLTVPLSTTASSASVTLDEATVPGLKDKKLFMLVDGLKGSLLFTLKVDKAEATTTAAPATTPAATTTTTTK
jgi:hypothetical protein